MRGFCLQWRSDYGDDRLRALVGKPSLDFFAVTGTLNLEQQE